MKLLTSHYPNLKCIDVVIFDTVDGHMPLGAFRPRREYAEHGPID